MLRFLGEDRSLVFDKLFEINVINKSFTAIRITNWRKKNRATENQKRDYQKLCMQISRLIFESVSIKDLYLIFERMYLLGK